MIGTALVAMGTERKGTQTSPIFSLICKMCPSLQGEVNRVTHDEFPGTLQAHGSTHGRRSSLQPIIIFKKYSLNIVCVPGTAIDARNTA